jgi:hypothetical protein
MDLLRIKEACYAKSAYAGRRGRECVVLGGYILCCRNYRRFSGVCENVELGRVYHLIVDEPRAR